MNKFIIYLFLSYVIINFVSCKEKRQESMDHRQDIKYKPDSLAENMIADTIIYDVIIKNPYPDDEWTEKCLGYLKRDKFVDQLFDAVYNKQATVYDFFTGEKISPRDLRKVEKNEDFEREKVGKVQFAETWYFDAANLTMEKRIIYIVLGYEFKGDSTEVIGYKPVFRINLN